MGHIAHVCRARVIGTEFRFPPKNFHPFTLDDVRKAFQQLTSLIIPEKVMIASDKAKGYFVLIFVLCL